MLAVAHTALPGDGLAVVSTQADIVRDALTKQLSYSTLAFLVTVRDSL